MKHKITILGLGPDDIEYLTVKANDILQSSKRIILRTDNCAAADYLSRKNKRYESCDFIYESAQNFNELEENIAEHIISQAKDEDVVYAVPGSAVYDDGSVDLICRKYDNTEVIPGVDTGEYMLSKSLPEGISSGVCSIPASMLTEAVINTRLPLIITSLDDQYTISEVKILLSEKYNDEHPVKIISRNKGTTTRKGEK